MMDERDQHVTPTEAVTTGPTQDGAPCGVPPHPAWPQQAMVLQPLPRRPLPKKPRVPQLWIIFAVIGLMLLLAPSVVTFLINLSPGDHSDNGDGQYWLSGLILLPCMIFGLLALFLAFCVGIGEWVVWVWTAHQQHVLSARMFIIPPVVIVAFYFVARFCAATLFNHGI